MGRVAPKGDEGHGKNGMKTYEEMVTVARLVSDTLSEIDLNNGSAEGVAMALRTEKAVGRRKSAADNPVSRFLSRCLRIRGLGDSVSVSTFCGRSLLYVTPASIAITMQPRDCVIGASLPHPAFVRLPDGVYHFLVRFNEGEFGELLEEAPETLKEVTS